MSSDRPWVSVIVPCRNEARWIASCLQSIIANDYPKDRLEVLVVDGMSDDGTRDAVEAEAARHPWIRMLDNPHRITPAALNVGIVAARGEVIVRMDAHNEYPPDYISSLVRWLEESGADNVGGSWVTRPANETVLARAIAAGLSHPVGVGNAHYRIGTPEPRWVDTVPFGCYRRAVFDRIGLFDEELVRNQDDEFNLRLKKSGGRILLVPQIASSYVARDSLRKVGRMMYQYGYFKPLVIRKIGAVMTVRQIVPAAFLLAVAFSAMAAAFHPAGVVLLAAILTAYGATIAAVSLALAVRRRAGWPLATAMVFPVLHVAYGLGFLKGAWDFFVLKKGGGRSLAAIPLTR